MGELFIKEESYKIIGACFEVHKSLGHGFKEVVYKDALEYELKRVGIAFEREKAYPIFYKEQKLKHFFVANFVILDSIILEIKAGSYVGDPYVKQTLNYLKASTLRLGIVVNFGAPSLEYKRVVF